MKKIISKLNLNFRLVSLLPYFIVSIILILLPTILLITNAFTPVENFSMKQTLQSELLWEVIGRSIWVGLLAALICVVIAFPFAYIVAKIKNKTLKITTMFLMISPLFVFTITRVFGLKSFLLVAIYDDPQSISSPMWVVVGLVYLNLPFAVVPIYFVVSEMPKSLEEASADLGQTRIKTFVKVVIPYCLKSIISSYTLVFMLASTSIVVSHVLGGTTMGNVKMIGNQIYNSASASFYSASEKMSTSLIAVVTIGIMNCIYFGIYFAPRAISKIRGFVNEKNI